MILPDTTLFPGATHPLRITQASHVKLIKDALEGARCFVLANQSSRKNLPCKVSGVGLIRAAILQNNQYHLILQGLARVLLEERTALHPYPIYQIAPLAEASTPNQSLNLLADELKKKVAFVVSKMNVKSFGFPPDGQRSSRFGQNSNDSLENFLSYLKGIKHPGVLADLVASTLIAPGNDRQTLLNVCSIPKRLRTALEIFCRTYGLSTSES